MTYAVGIYLLNLFIAFLTPKIDPALDTDGKSFNGTVSLIINQELVWDGNMSFNGLTHN